MTDISAVAISHCTERGQDGLLVQITQRLDVRDQQAQIDAQLESIRSYVSRCCTPPVTGGCRSSPNTCTL